MTMLVCLTGDAAWECKGILCTLDCTEQIVEEAIKKNCNLVVAHHPIIFGGLKKINGKNYVEKTVITAIKNDIAIYAIHTNLDNVIDGVNSKIAEKLGLLNRTFLHQDSDLKKVIHFCANRACRESSRCHIQSGRWTYWQL